MESNKSNYGEGTANEIKSESDDPLESHQPSDHFLDRNENRRLTRPEVLSLYSVSIGAIVVLAVSSLIFFAMRSCQSADHDISRFPLKIDVETI